MKFINACHCTGQVEGWLNLLMCSMRETIRWESHSTQVNKSCFHMSKHIPIHRHRHRHPKISSFVSFVTPGHLLLHPSSLMSTHQETSGSSFTQLRFLTATKTNLQHLLGCPGRHSDLLDNRSEQRVPPVGGGVRERKPIYE